MEIVKVRFTSSEIDRLTNSIIAKVDLSDSRLYSRGLYYSITDFSELISPQFRIEFYKDGFETSICRFILEFFNKEGNEVDFHCPSIEQRIKNHFYQNHEQINYTGNVCCLKEGFTV